MDTLGASGLGGTGAGAGAGTGLTAAETAAAPADTGLLSQAASWAKENPALVYGGTQVLGSGLSGMATASTEADKLAAQEDRDAEIRRNSAYVKVPKTVWA
jgi:hypothetical protein